MMNKQGRWYTCINITVLLVTAIVFIKLYNNLTVVFHELTPVTLFILIVTVCLVHLIKSGRLYLALYGSNIRRTQYIKLYCKVTPVSMIIPFKVGEFFRMYCYGKQLGNMMKGIIIVLLDRFMDTAALITVILLFWVFYGGYMPSFIYMLFIFLVFVLLVYAVFPGVCRFWKGYFLRAKATENKLVVLKAIGSLDVLYQEVAQVVKGRGIILYFMSLAAWGVEIINIKLLNEITGEGEFNQTVFGYLTAAMNGNQSVLLEGFVFVSVILLLIVYFFREAAEMMSGKKADGI